VAYEGDVALGGMTFVFDNGISYYFSAANTPAVEKDPSSAVGHAIMWNAIRHLKNEARCKQLEIGPIEFRSQVCTSPSSKQENITKFKLGFGGRLTPVIYLTKCVDADAVAQFCGSIVKNVSSAASQAQ
jgi:hypothetical protein